MSFEAFEAQKDAQRGQDLFFQYLSHERTHRQVTALPVGPERTRALVAINNEINQVLETANNERLNRARNQVQPLNPALNIEINPSQNLTETQLSVRFNFYLGHAGPENPFRAEDYIHRVMNNTVHYKSNIEPMNANGIIAQEYQWRRVALTTPKMNEEIACISYINVSEGVVDWPVTFANCKTLIEEYCYTADNARRFLLSIVSYFKPELMMSLKNSTSTEIARAVLTSERHFSKIDYYRKKILSSVRLPQESILQAMAKVDGLITQAYEANNAEQQAEAYKMRMLALFSFTPKAAKGCIQKKVEIYYNFGTRFSIDEVRDKLYEFENLHSIKLDAPLPFSSQYSPDTPRLFHFSASKSSHPVSKARQQYQVNQYFDRFYKSLKKISPEFRELFYENPEAHIFREEPRPRQVAAQGQYPPMMQQREHLAAQGFEMPPPQWEEDGFEDQHLQDVFAEPVENFEDDIKLDDEGGDDVKDQVGEDEVALEPDGPPGMYRCGVQHTQFVADKAAPKIPGMSEGASGADGARRRERALQEAQAAQMAQEERQRQLARGTTKAPGKAAQTFADIAPNRGRASRFDVPKRGPITEALPRGRSAKRNTSTGREIIDVSGPLSKRVSQSDRVTRSRGNSPIPPGSWGAASYDVDQSVAAAIDKQMQKLKIDMDAKYDFARNFRSEVAAKYDPQIREAEVSKARDKPNVASDQQGPVKQDEAPQDPSKYPPGLIMNMQRYDNGRNNYYRRNDSRTRSKEYYDGGRYEDNYSRERRGYKNRSGSRYGRDHRDRRRSNSRGRRFEGNDSRRRFESRSPGYRFNGGRREESRDRYGSRRSNSRNRGYERRHDSRDRRDPSRRSRYNSGSRNFSRPRYDSRSRRDSRSRYGSRNRSDSRGRDFRSQSRDSYYRNNKDRRSRDQSHDRDRRFKSRQQSRSKSPRFDARDYKTHFPKDKKDRTKDDKEKSSFNNLARKVRLRSTSPEVAKGILRCKRCKGTPHAPEDCPVEVVLPTTYSSDDSE